MNSYQITYRGETVIVRNVNSEADAWCQFVNNDTTKRRSEAVITLVTN